MNFDQYVSHVTPLDHWIRYHRRILRKTPTIYRPSFASIRFSQLRFQRNTRTCTEINKKNNNNKKKAYQARRHHPPLVPTRMPLQQPCARVARVALFIYTPHTHTNTLNSHHAHRVYNIIIYTRVPTCARSCLKHTRG